MNSTTNIPLVDLNPHLLCVLCGGYLIDATTIIECIHSFCRSCIIRYLETSKYCPICDVQVHKTRPLANVRSDKTLQTLVYKLVPGLFKDEMKKRRVFYADKPDPETNRSARSSSEERGEIKDHNVVSAKIDDEKISLCLQYCDRLPPFKNGSWSSHQSPKDKRRGEDRRFLLCPSGVTVGHVRKFIRLKFDLPHKYRIVVFYSDEALLDVYTLLDVAHIYGWRRMSPLKLYYIVYDDSTATLPVSPLGGISRHDTAPASAPPVHEQTMPIETGNHGDELPAQKVTHPAVDSAGCAGPEMRPSDAQGEETGAPPRVKKKKSKKKKKKDKKKLKQKLGKGDKHKSSKRSARHKKHKKHKNPDCDKIVIHSSPERITISSSPEKMDAADSEVPIRGSSSAITASASNSSGMIETGSRLMTSASRLLADVSKTKPTEVRSGSEEPSKKKFVDVTDGNDVARVHQASATGRSEVTSVSHVVGQNGPVKPEKVHRHKKLKKRKDTPALGLKIHEKMKASKKKCKKDKHVMGKKVKSKKDKVGHRKKKRVDLKVDESREFPLCLTSEESSASTEVLYIFPVPVPVPVPVPDLVSVSVPDLVSVSVPNLAPSDSEKVSSDPVEERVPQQPSTLPPVPTAVSVAPRSRTEEDPSVPITSRGDNTAESSTDSQRQPWPSKKDTDLASRSNSPVPARYDVAASPASTPSDSRSMTTSVSSNPLHLDEPVDLALTAPSREEGPAQAEVHVAQSPSAQAALGDDCPTSPIIPVKRKRGRPPKDPEAHALKKLKLVQKRSLDEVATSTQESDPNEHNLVVRQPLDSLAKSSTTGERKPQVKKVKKVTSRESKKDRQHGKLVVKMPPLPLLKKKFKPTSEDSVCSSTLVNGF